MPYNVGLEVGGGGMQEGAGILPFFSRDLEGWPVPPHLAQWAQLTL